MDKEELRTKANEARKAAMILAESIYKFLGYDISKTELKQIVDSIISDDRRELLEHKYILKDTYSDLSTTGFMEDLECDLNEDEI